MTSPDPNKGSEFGGVAGRIQPPPHDPADHPSEVLGLIYSTNPAGDTSQPRYTPDPNDPTVPPTQRLR